MTSPNKIPPHLKHRFHGMGKGYIRWIVLALLAEQPGYGYDLQQAIADTCSGWRPSPGTLYPVLHDLKRLKLIDGHTEKKEGRRRIVYELTPKGRDELEAGAIQHMVFVTAMRKILGKHGPPALVKHPIMDVDHLLPGVQKRVKLLLDEVDFLSAEIAADPPEAVQRLRNRLQHLQEHAKRLNGAITRVQARLRKLEQRAPTVRSQD